MKEEIKKEMELPEGVSATLEGNILIIKGKKGENKRNFVYPGLKIEIVGNKIVMGFMKSTKREKKVISTYEAHINNMIKGVTEPFVYKMKICSGHFPMNVSVNGKKVIVKNFLGEKCPREANLIEGADVKINGTEILITSCSKENAGQTAARIEKLCNIKNKDIRIFQDGIYITEKPKIVFK
ncbi:50S ribosomal protein L6 [archaeon]|jgi:large subunit ribosomal protein L6|nr:50S ribosomal protein L6 [archaeon]MBT3450712.1 50S ribosomal protein L6 [archaeon]MBT6869204.1 50S ribosomal protein L6 [archaeon]MBT7193740.1 50S ribosomal protein L6 [archaeon]MBT7381387.1 50S ribosomal protein L6 [archaeon]